MVLAGETTLARYALPLAITVRKQRLDILRHVGASGREELRNADRRRQCLRLAAELVGQRSLPLMLLLALLHPGGQ